MKLLTTRGVVDLRERRWPLSGLDAPQRKSNGSTSLLLAKGPNGQLTTASLAKLYRSNPYIYAATNLIARGVSRMPLHVFEFDSEGNRKRVRGDLPGSAGRPSAGAALDKLLRTPEPLVSTNEWLGKVMLDRLVFGNALIVKEKTESGSLARLWHVPWQRVVVQTGETVPIEHYEIGGTVGNIAPSGPRFIPEEVIHLGRGRDLDGTIGLSPLEALRSTIALYEALARHLIAFYENSARPSGLLKVQPQTAQNDRLLEKIQEQVRALYASPENAGKILVTSGEFEPLTDTSNQKAIIELARLSREEIAAAFGLLPVDLGDLTHATYSNVGQARSRFVRDVLGQWLAEFEDDFQAQITLPPGTYIEFQTGEALRPDLEARAEVYEKMRGVLTPNEMRALEGLPPLKQKGADELWIMPGSKSTNTAE